MCGRMGQRDISQPPNLRRKQTRSRRASQHFLLALFCICIVVPINSTYCHHGEEKATETAISTTRTEHSLTGEYSRVELIRRHSKFGLRVEVGGQPLLLGLDTTTEGLRLFASNSSACSNDEDMLHKRQETTRNRPDEFSSRLHQSSEWKDKRSPENGLVLHDGDFRHNRSGTTAMYRTIAEKNSRTELGRDAVNNGRRKERNDVASPLQCYDPEKSSTAQWCLNWRQNCSPLAASPFVCNVAKYADPTHAVTYRVVVDGILLHEMRLEGQDNVHLSLQSLSDRKLPDLTFDNFPIKLVVDRQKSFDAFRGLDGVWGIAGPELCCRNASLWNSLTEGDISAIGLDISVENSSHLTTHMIIEGGGRTVGDVPQTDESRSYLLFGKDPNLLFGPMLWSERIQTGSVLLDSVPHFTAYDWRLCGEDVMHPLSTNWEVVLDLRSECMVVPHPLWASLREWLPVNKTHEFCRDPPDFPDFEDSTMPPLKIESVRKRVAHSFNGTDRYSSYTAQASSSVARRTCPLLPQGNNGAGIGTTRPTLPVLSFGLTQDAKESERVALPLERLVYFEEAVNGEALCVVPQPYVSMTASEWRQIRLGTRAMSAFEVVLDREKWRVGLKSKPWGPPSDAACATKPICMGDQHYIPATNECADPACDSQLLYEINSESKRCELAWWVPGTAVTIVALLVVSEFVEQHVQRRVIGSACSGTS